MESKKGERQRAWRADNPERARAYSKAYIAANPERVRAWRKTWAATRPKQKRTQTHRKSRYHGFTRIEVLACLAAQGGVCAVCRTAELGKKGGHGDHNHDTGRFRAVLCHSCNVAIGLLKDSPERCRAAAAYLDRHNALDALI